MGVNHKERFINKKDERQAILDQLTAKESLYYFRECLLPCLNLEMQIKERGREELSSLDITLLQLIKRGVCVRDELSYLTGLAGRSIERKLREKQGQSLLGVCQGRVYLTSLGEESLALGVPVRLVDRALLYCPLSKRLLPREAYSRDFLKAQEMDPATLRFRELLAEPEKVPLTGLNLTSIPDKHAVKLPDEIVGFEQCLNYEPGFISAHLGVSGKKGPEQGWIAWKKAVYSYQLDQIKPLMSGFEPGARVRRDSEQTAASLIEAEFEELGVSLKSRLKIDRTGVPSVVASDANDEWLSSKMPYEQPWILLCGTRKTPPVPVARFPTNKADVLKGHTLQVWIENKRLEPEIDLLRAANDAIERDSAQKGAQREYASTDAMLHDRFSPEELSKIAELVQRYEIKGRLGKHFG